MPELMEIYFRIQRLAALAPSSGPVAVSAATQIYNSMFELTRTKTAEVADLRRDVDTFNQAVRVAHAEMLASKTLR